MILLSHEDVRFTEKLAIDPIHFTTHRGANAADDSEAKAISFALRAIKVTAREIVNYDHLRLLIGYLRSLPEPQKRQLCSAFRTVTLPLSIDLR